MRPNTKKEDRILENSSTEDTVRLNVVVPMSLHKQLHRYLPWGTKAEIVRQLLQILIEAQQEDTTRLAIQDLLEGRLKLVRK